MMGKCPYCKSNLEIGENVKVGQNVICKYCERKFAYGIETPTPIRIDVPRRKSGPMSDQAEKCEVVCPQCHEKLMLNAKPVKGQSVKCSSCQRKFAYEPIFDYRSEIVSADIEFAIESVLKNARQKSIYDGATDGARLFLGLLHYGRVFEYRIDLLKYWKLRDEVLAEMKEPDIRYVLQYESDQDIRNSLNKALSRLVSKEIRPIDRPRVVESTISNEKHVVPSGTNNNSSAFSDCTIPPKVLNGRGSALYALAWASIAVVLAVFVVSCVLLVSHQLQDREDKIVQNPGVSRESMLLVSKELETRIEEKISELKSKLEELQSTCNRDLDDLEVRIGEVEAGAKRDASDQDEKWADKLSTLTEKVRELSEKIESGQLKQRESKEEKEVVVRKPETTRPVKTPTESVSDLQKKVAKNLLEIKRLRVENPACVLYAESNTKNIRNLSYRMCTNGDKRYCCREQITFVRHHFYCTGCNKEHDEKLCTSSRTSWPQWKAAYDNVAKTLEINKRIDALREENGELKNRILSFNK